MNTPRNNPRIIITVNENNVSVKGAYIDFRDNTYSINKQFNTENEAKDYLNIMRENNSEFSIQVNRINWKMH